MVLNIVGRDRSDSGCFHQSRKTARRRLIDQPVQWWRESESEN